MTLYELEQLARACNVARVNRGLVIHAFTDAAVAMNCGTFEQAADRKPAELEAFLKTYLVRLVLEEQDS